MRWVAMLLFTATAVSAIIFSGSIKTTLTSASKTTPAAKLPATAMRKSGAAWLKKYSGEARAYTTKHGLNNRYCFLIDMQQPSGRKRFFVYDLENDSILLAGLVTNGSGIGNITDTVVFSNEPGSNCTSLGKYKIGMSYYGKFGLAWKLYGLDKTNSNAFNRFVVLHAHLCVPDSEITNGGICQSWGCPTVSPGFLSELKIYLDQSPAPMMLWIFN